jgi:L,D-peptidoglycan transpeptidase YkuD (ErfK/YbiS/YcfS/YnhG family)
MILRKVTTAAAALFVTAAAVVVAPAPAAEAAAQVYNPCARATAGQTKYSTYGANRVTFVTTTSRAANVATLTSCVRSGGTYKQEWQDWGYIGLKGFAAPGLTWEDTYKSPTGSYSVTEALGRANPGTALKYYKVNRLSRWGGERGARYNQYFEGTGGPSDENLYTYMNQGYYEQAAVINYNRQPDMKVTQGASFAIFLHAGRVPSAGCVSTSLATTTRFLRTARPGDRIIMGAVDDVFTPYSSNPFGAIMGKYAATGSVAGALKSPTNREFTGLKNGGAARAYQGGNIYWSSRTGAKIVKGGILSKWASLGAYNGSYGYPSTDEFAVRYGTAQKFQNGTAITWNGSTAHSVTGAVGARWQGASYIGPAQMAMKPIKNGGYYQGFRTALIYWTSATGAKLSYGATHTAWGKTGFEGGRLGYPKTDPYKTSKGTSQNFQGGRIDVSTKGVASIVYGTSVPVAK